MNRKYFDQMVRLIDDANNGPLSGRACRGPETNVIVEAVDRISHATATTAGLETTPPAHRNATTNANNQPNPETIPELARRVVRRVRESQ